MPKKSQRSVDEDLKRFSDLPAEAHVRAPVVQALFAVSRTTMWRAIGDYIPEPKRFGGGKSLAFNVGELRKALKA